MGQGDHSKQCVVTIKIPDPVIAFLNFQNEGDLRKKLEKDIQAVVWGSSKVELPPNYWVNVRKLFSFLDKSYAIMFENILKYPAPTEGSEDAATGDDVRNYLTQLEMHTATLKKSFETLLQQDIPEEVKSASIDEGLSAGQEILGYFADRNGLLCRKHFLTSPFLVTVSGVYRSFSKMWTKLEDGSRRRKEMERMEDTLIFYKNQCIQERLDNIKMLRVQSESYNVHDYSYEAQVRRDVAFGGMVKDFYDKRPTDQITFHDEKLTVTSESEIILSGYKDKVKMEYELFFGAVLHDESGAGAD